jgi:hypothetical protein
VKPGSNLVNKYRVCLYETIVSRKYLVIEAPDAELAQEVAQGVFTGELESHDEDWEPVNQLDSGVAEVQEVPDETATDVSWDEVDWLDEDEE